MPTEFAHARGSDRFAEGITLWSKLIATAAPEKRPAMFRVCVKEGADYVRQGAPLGDISAALIERAARHNLVDELGGLAAVETIVAKGLTEPDKPPPKLVRVNIARYDTEPIPEREWGVRDRFPRHNVALMSGEGAIGKSILFLQLATAHVLGRDWLRSVPEQGPVVLINCEDNEAELVRRLQPVLKSYNATFGDVAEDLHLFPLVDGGADPLLAGLDRKGRIVATPLYGELLEKVREVQPVCTVIDNVADVFGGSEIDRSHVRQFVALMRQLAIAANGYVIMSAHPSLTGIASKTGLSGSTQWHNSVRARAYMHVQGKDDDNDDDPGTRVLEFMKSNYSALAEQIELQWANGLFVPTRAPSGPEQAAAQARADALFLDLLDRHIAKGDNLSAKRNANNYAPTVLAESKEAKSAKVSKDQFSDALDRLMTAGKVAVQPYGPPSKHLYRIARGFI
jgi:RecA-family ATPase